MNQIISSLLSWLKSLKGTWRYIAVFLIAAAASVYMLTSCANTKAIVRTPADNSQASISISTNNPTSVTITNRPDSTFLKFNTNKK